MEQTSSQPVEDPNALVFCSFAPTPFLQGAGLIKIDQSGDVSTYELRSPSREIYEPTAEDLAALEAFKL